jgi:hypothetical protein
MFFPLQFSTPNPSHHTPFLYASILSPSLLQFHFFHNKTKKKWTILCTEGAKVTVHLSNKLLHCAESGDVPHIERSRWLHVPNHKVLKLTFTVLSAICAVHSFADTHTLTQILLPTDQQEIFPHPVPQTHITLQNASHSKANIQRFTSLN